MIRLLSFVGICLLSLGVVMAQSPITIDFNDMPVVGDNVVVVRDTMPSGLTVGNAGAAQTWDFTGIVQRDLDTTRAVNPATTPYAANFGASNIALTNDFASYVYADINAQKYEVDGLAGDIGNIGVVVSAKFTPPLDNLRFPTQYQNTYSGSYSATPVTVGANQVPPGLIPSSPLTTVDSIRLNISATYVDNIDAWGTVQTPLGCYPSLRQMRTSYTTTVVDAYVSILGGPYNWQNGVATIMDTSDAYSWWAKGGKLPVVTIGFDTLGNINLATYSTIPPSTAPEAAFSFNVSGSTGLFTDQSKLCPDSWAWDFGDGTNGTMQNPAHMYSANGDYEVCLTVTNSAGNSTFCDTVSITGIGGANNPPIAVDDNATVEKGGSVNIPVTSNDVEPDGDNIIISALGTPAHGLVGAGSNGTIDYDADQAYVGPDSFYYVICDDVVPSLCDTGMVYINVTATPPAPTASFSMDNDTCVINTGVSFTFYNTSTNDTGMAIFNFGDGSGATGDTVQHSYAAEGRYEVCVTVSNAQGSDTYCDSVDYFICVGIAEIEKAAFSLYPNPAKDQLMVRMDQTLNSAIVINLFDLTGKQVNSISAPPSAAYTVDVSSLNAGIYFMQMNSVQGELLGRAKFVIAH